MASTGKVTVSRPTTNQFAAAFKQTRLQQRWRQEDLAKKLHVTLRAVVSWETGTRLPSAGLVFLLCMLLADDQRATTDLLQQHLLISYLVDDLQRQTQVHTDEAFRLLANQGVQRLMQISEEQYQSEQAHEALSLPLEHTDGGEQHLVQQSQQSQWQGHQDETSPVTLQQLFALFEQLRERPELIGVVHDFLQELTGT
jgi:transcriptional regulator with XRE-family HTH domain